MNNIIDFINNIRKENDEKENNKSPKYVYSSVDLENQEIKLSSVNEDGIPHGMTVKKDYINSLNTFIRMFNGCLREYKQVNTETQEESSFIINDLKKEIRAVYEIKENGETVRVVLNINNENKSGTMTLYLKDKILIGEVAEGKVINWKEQKID